MQELLRKAGTTGLNEEEQMVFLKGINDELLQLKEQDPERYLQLLQEMNDIVERLNAAVTEA